MNRVLLYNCTLCLFLVISYSKSWSQEQKKEAIGDSLMLIVDELSGLKKAETLYKIAEIASKNKDKDFLFSLNKVKTFSKTNQYFEISLKSLILELMYYLRRGKHKKVVEVAKKGIDLSSSSSNEAYLGKFYNLLPYSYSVLEDYTNQYESSKKAVFYSEKYQDTINMINAYNNLGTFYWLIEELELAIDENKKAFNLAEYYQKYKRKTSLLINRSVFYYSRKQYQNAIITLKAALNIATTKRDTAHIYQSTGITYYLMDSIKLGFHFINKSFEYYKSSDEYNRIGNYYYYSGLLYLKTHELKKANKMLNHALPFAINASAIAYEAEIYNKKYFIFKILGPMDSTLYFLEKYKALDDSVRSLNNLKNLIRTKWKENLKIKEIENNQLENNAEMLNKNLLAEQKINLFKTVALSVFGIILIMLIVILNHRKKNNEAKKIIAELKHLQKIELKNKELLTLKIQRVNRGQKIEELNEKLNFVKSNLEDNKLDSKEVIQDLASISSKIDFDTEKDWEDFKLYFEKLNKNFFSSLTNRYPNISKSDEKLCAYIQIGLDSKQIARILNVLPNTIKKQKNRLRKKMDLPMNSEIKEYLDFD